MPKFLGVISNSAANYPSDDRVLEFTDLNLLADLFYNETQNLFNEFLQKLDFINDREVQICDNSAKILQISGFHEGLCTKTLEMERDVDEVGCWLCRMEQAIDRLEQIPKDLVACRCTSNLERNRTLEMFVQISENINRIGNQLDVVKEHESGMPVKNPFDLTSKLLPFLDLYVKILEQIERKISTLSDLLNEVDRAFIFAQKKLTGACIHKERHEYASDC